MQQLRASLRVLARQLAALGIAHGDIQPSNIIVRGAMDLCLIDYDGMFVPELASLGSAELGQRNFQHPGRRWRHYHARLDGFSFAVMDVALGALAYRPELWDDARCNESAFVFRAEDFIEPYASAAFGWVSEIPGLEVKTQYLAAICQSPFDEAPGIEDFLAGRNIPAPRVRVSSQPFRTHRPRYLPAFPVVDAAQLRTGMRACRGSRRAHRSHPSLADVGRDARGWRLDPCRIRRVPGRHGGPARTHGRPTASKQRSTGSGRANGSAPSASSNLRTSNGSRNTTASSSTLQIEHHSQITTLSSSEARHRLAASAARRLPG